MAIYWPTTDLVQCVFNDTLIKFISLSADTHKLQAYRTVDFKPVNLPVDKSKPISCDNMLFVEEDIMSTDELVNQWIPYNIHLSEDGMKNFINGIAHDWENKKN